MRTALSVTLLVCLLAVSGMVCVFLERVTQAVSDIRTVARDADEGVKAITQSARDLEAVIALERDAQKRQTEEVNKTIADVHDLVIHTDLQLNQKDGLIPTASTALALETVALDNLLKESGKSLETLTAAGNSTLDAGTGALDTFRTRLTDPRIDEIVGNLQTTTFEFAGTTTDVHTELHKFVYPPPRKWWQKYGTDPLKFAAHLITIPISSF